MVEKAAIYRLTDEGSKPGKSKALEMLVDGDWKDISGALNVGQGANYRLRWTDHRWETFVKGYDEAPLITYYDKDGNVIEP